MGRSRSGLTSKLHALINCEGIAVTLLPPQHLPHGGRERAVF